MQSEYERYPGLRGAAAQQRFLLSVVVDHLKPEQRAAIITDLARSFAEEGTASPAEVGMDPHDFDVSRWLAAEALSQLRT